MEDEELEGILRSHRKWLDHEGGERANLHLATLRHRNLRNACLRHVKLAGADLLGTDLQNADLQDADLSDAILRSANMRGADLRGADLTGADLSGAKGLLPAAQFIKDNFESDDRGVIVYKVFRLHWDPPASWVLSPGFVVEEVPNPCRTVECGCGVNVATRAWVEENLESGAPIWRCRIAWLDLADTVVPFGTDGKIRTARIRLLEKV